MSRVVAWFSHGGSSAVAAALAVGRWPSQVLVVCCDTTASEHPDNQRFRREVEQWIGRSIIMLKSEKYTTVDEVFIAERYMSGIAGAKCTVELKKMPRFAFQEPDDIHVFGFTAEEGKRIRRMELNNPELTFEWNLRDQFVTKKECLRLLRKAGIEPPKMYELGFEHNNCLGCVKAQSPGYWNKTRKHFPGVFRRRAEQSRELGVRLVKLHGVRIFLDELPIDAGINEPDGDIECGPLCSTEQLSFELA